MKITIAEPLIHTDLAEFYSLWRDACLGKKVSEAEEIKFLLDIFASSSTIKSVIDLGGAVGLHAIALAKHGFDVTLLDKSETALAIAKRTFPELKMINRDFETLSLDQHFDAGICMLASVNYLLDQNGQNHFYQWLKTHINDLVIIDQPNFYRLPKSYSDNCQAEDRHFRLNILREWHFEDEIMHTSYNYEFVDKASDATKIINDGQKQKFHSAEELIQYMGKQWRVIALLGDCNLKHAFDQEIRPG